MRRRPAWNGDGTTVAVETDQAELRSDATSRAAKKAGRKAVPKKVGLPLSGRRGLLPLRPPDHGSAGIATFRRKNEDLSLALSSVSQSSSCEIEQIRAHPADFEQ